MEIANSRNKKSCKSSSYLAEADTISFQALRFPEKLNYGNRKFSKARKHENHRGGLAEGRQRQDHTGRPSGGDDRARRRRARGVVRPGSAGDSEWVVEPAPGGDPCLRLGGK